MACTGSITGGLGSYTVSTTAKTVRHGVLHRPVRVAILFAIYSRHTSSTAECPLFIVRLKYPVYNAGHTLSPSTHRRVCRREKDKSSSSSVTPVMPFETSGPSHTSRPTYFDAYPRTKPTANVRPSKGHRSSSSTRAILRHNNPPLTHDSSAPSYAFPTFDCTEDIVVPTAPNQYPRVRSRTGPSGRSTWEAPSSVLQLRFSGSSSTQLTETPPHTPVDFNQSTDYFDDFPVVVAAPIAGVETMDALVDGMNGGDDILSHSTSISNRPRFGIPGHHPLYQPPLPTPPPGIVLGGGKARRPKRNIDLHSSGSDAEDEAPAAVFPPRPRSRRTRTAPHHTPSSTIISSPVLQPLTSEREPVPTVQATPRKSTPERLKSVVPSISEIIRTHAPPEGQARSRPSTSRSSSYYSRSQGHSIVQEEVESEPEPISREEEGEILSRSSIDSVADEVQRTLRSQLLNKPRPPPPPPPSAYINRHSMMSDNASLYSPHSDPGAGSVHSSSIGSNPYPASPLDVTSFTSLTKPSTGSQEVAKYLRSARLTTLLHLTRSPHASADCPLTVSLSDLGSSTGHPVVVFLGLGCVRHIMGLYDEMAEILNLRLITIDRWGLGRTEPRSKSAKGIMQWASVVEEVLDLLHIEQCSIMAHSAGAPYALSFANRVPGRIRGHICLLAPWVGGSESSGYKWLKYVPNGILKTAQAADWKIQAWMIGKPPAIAYEGIGYNAQPTKPSDRRASSPRPNANLDVHYPHESRPRPSIGSSTFSDYDDLRDFDGRFESRSTLGAGGPRAPLHAQASADSRLVNKRKTSRGFLDRLKGSSSSPQSPSEEKSFVGGKKLKGLRSMSSLKGKAAQKRVEPEPASPQLPLSLQIEVGLGFSELDWPKAHSDVSLSDREATISTTPKQSVTSSGLYGRSVGQRSISFTSPKATLSMPASPSFSTADSSYTRSVDSGSTYQATLGNALIAASHAESAKGTHNDLLQILNHDNHPWGFSYASYPHHVKVWYGDRDEKIAENAVRWMANNMGESRCSVKVVKGADHGLMYRSSVVVEGVFTVAIGPLKLQVETSVFEVKPRERVNSCLVAAMSSRRPSPSPQKRPTALKRVDGEPLTRFDIQYDVLHSIFCDTHAVFTNPYSSNDPAPKITFRDLYLATILHSSKATKALKDKMADSEMFSEDFAMLALLVNVGRVNTTMSFFPEMKTAIRTYHPIPALQRTTGNLQDAPRIKHILKSTALKNDHGPAPSTPADILSRAPIGHNHFADKLDFTDLFVRENISSLSRARAFLWLCYHYLESPIEDTDDDYDDDTPTNPFADSRRGNLPTFIFLSDIEIIEENMDPDEEKVLAEKLVVQRLEILKTQGAKESARQNKTTSTSATRDMEIDSVTDREVVKPKAKQTPAKAPAAVNKGKKASSGMAGSIKPKKEVKGRGREIISSPIVHETDDEYDFMESSVTSGNAKNQYPQLKYRYQPQLQFEPHRPPPRDTSVTPEPRGPARHPRPNQAPHEISAANLYPAAAAAKVHVRTYSFKVRRLEIINALRRKEPTPELADHRHV
ncbi:hypothetical protein DXG01_000056 [Tephrocybe rancida]|nr:hypothetical protein DXG01_000056 [Tephrocybe rancida]